MGPSPAPAARALPRGRGRGGGGAGPARGPRLGPDPAKRTRESAGGGIRRPTFLGVPSNVLADAPAGRACGERVVNRIRGSCGGDRAPHPHLRRGPSPGDGGEAAEGLGRPGGPGWGPVLRNEPENRPERASGGPLLSGSRATSLPMPQRGGRAARPGSAAWYSRAAVRGAPWTSTPWREPASPGLGAGLALRLRSVRHGPTGHTSGWKRAAL